MITPTAARAKSEMAFAGGVRRMMSGDDGGLVVAAARADGRALASEVKRFSADQVAICARLFALSLLRMFWT
jgi:hypothetical protein